MRSLYSLAWRNLASRRLRTCLTGMAIALGVAAVFATSMIGQAMQVSTASLAGRISGADLQLTPRDGATLDARWLDVVRAHPDVALASPEIVYSTVLLDPPGASLMLLGVEPETYMALERPEMANGLTLTSKQKQGIVLPERWAEEHKVRVGGRLVISMDNGAPVLSQPALEMLVVGIIKHRDDAVAVLRDRTALVPLTTLQDALGLRRQLSRIRLSLQPGRDLVRTEATLTRALQDPQAQTDAVVVSKAERGSSTFTLYGIMMGGLALAGAVTLWAAALLITNTFAINMTERTRQIGILRALGMGEGDVLRGVLAEAAWLGALGTLAGVPLGWSLAQAIVSALVVWQRIEFEQLSWSAVGLMVALVVGMGVALVAALWPARRAAQVSPLAAIHPQRENRAEQDLPRTWVLGVPLGVAALAVTVWTSTTAGVRTLDVNSAIILCMLMPLVTLVSGMLLLPLPVTGLAELSRELLARRLGVVGRLAGDQLVRRRQRTLLTAGTLTLGLAMIILMSSTSGALVRTGGDLLFGLMKEDFMLVPFSPDESLESTSLLSPQRQQEWPRGVLALLDSVRDRASVYRWGSPTRSRKWRAVLRPTFW